jgi:hypothetical protein
MLRPMVMNDEIRASIKAVVDHAEANRIGVEELTEIFHGRKTMPTMVDRRFCCEVPVGYRVAFTIEQQPPSHWCRHISISVDDGAATGKYPNDLAVQEIMREFGMSGDFGRCVVYRQQAGSPGIGPSINLIEKINDGPAPASRTETSAPAGTGPAAESDSSSPKGT